MRPAGETQTRLVEKFKGKNVIVYAVPEGTCIGNLEYTIESSLMPLTGTVLPEDLILVHEHGDHYSLQPAVEMPLSSNASMANKRTMANVKYSPE
jgi:hypothetical protein